MYLINFFYLDNLMRSKPWHSLSPFYKALLSWFSKGAIVETWRFWRLCCWMSQNRIGLVSLSLRTLGLEPIWPYYSILIFRNCLEVKKKYSFYFLKTMVFSNFVFKYTFKKIKNKNLFGYIFLIFWFHKKKKS